MKLNPKTQSLLLFFLTNIVQIQAGSNFNTCLGKNAYNGIVKYGSRVVDKQKFMCDTGSENCSPAPCSFCGNINAQCNKIDQAEFCVTTGASATKLPGALCGGILGEVTPVNAAAGSCPNYEAVINTLSVVYTAPTFSWLCCSNDKCVVPANVAVDAATSIANTNCPASQYSLMCFNDAGGWSCTGNVANSLNLTQPIGDCVMQVTFPDPNFSTLEPGSSSTNTNKVTVTVTAKVNEAGETLQTVALAGVGYSVIVILATIIIKVWGWGNLLFVLI